MRLAIVIPTFNRSKSLSRTLDSILAASVPQGLEITVAAVDNRSTDDTKAIVERYSQASKGMIRYVAENSGQGRSFALNAGILSTESEFLGFVDDDEEIAGNWLQIVFSAFADSSLDYLGGRYLPCWEHDPPAWVNHPQTRTAIGWADFGDCRRDYAEKGFDALLMGGNCVLRRACFVQVGLYCNSLGRRGTRLLAGEDSDMHERLISAGLKGLYVPELVVYHHIPAQRLTRKYMRRWTFWSSASTGYMLRNHKESGAVWCGLPRYMFTNAARAQVKWLRGLLTRGNPAETFHQELRFWRLWGTIYGRHLLSDPGMN